MLTTSQFYIEESSFQELKVVPHFSPKKDIHYAKSVIESFMTQNHLSLKDDNGFYPMDHQKAKQLIPGYDYFVKLNNSFLVDKNYTYILGFIDYNKVKDKTLRKKLDNVFEFKNRRSLDYEGYKLIQSVYEPKKTAVIYLIPETYVEEPFRRDNLIINLHNACQKFFYSRDNKPFGCNWMDDFLAFPWDLERGNNRKNIPEKLYQTWKEDWKNFRSGKIKSIKAIYLIDLDNHVDGFFGEFLMNGGDERPLLQSELLQRGLFGESIKYKNINGYDYMDYIVIRPATTADFVLFKKVIS